MPAATIATSSPSRSVFEPPTGNASSAPYTTGVSPRVVRRYEMPVEVAHRADECGRLVAVARVEHRRAVDRAELREVLEPHLRRAVLADRDARVRAAEPERRAAHGRHPHEVVRAGEEGGERRAERLPAEHLHPHGGRDHLLLRDVHLDEALRVGVAEDIGERRVGDLAVERDDLSVLGAERGQRLAVRLAGRDGAADLVRRPRRGRRLEAVRAPGSGFATSTRTLRMPPSSSTASSATALPCQPFSFSTLEYPLPFTVRATIAVGRPDVDSASR